MERAMSVQWVLFGVICAVFYGYVALDYDTDPASCIASEEFEKRVVFQGTPEEWAGITIDEEKYIDVGARFTRVFDICFWASIFILISGVIHTIFRHKFVRIPARTAVVMAQWTLFVTVVVGLFSRFAHTGKVCSGDFLADAESTEGYLVTQGTMLSVILYIWGTLMGLGLCIGLVAFFLATS